MTRFTRFFAVAIFMVSIVFISFNTAMADRPGPAHFNEVYEDTLYLLPGEYFAHWQQCNVHDWNDRIVDFDFSISFHDFAGNDNFFFNGTDNYWLSTLGSIYYEENAYSYHANWIAYYEGIESFHAFIIQFANNIPVGNQACYDAFVHGHVLVNEENTAGFYDHLVQTLISVDGIKGDANGDGEISGMDVAIIQEYCFNPTGHLEWRYQADGINVGRGIMLFDYSSLLDGWFINRWLEDPNDPLVSELGIGQLISESYEGVVLSMPYEVSQIDDELTVTTDALAVMVSGRLSDNTHWQADAFTSNGQVAFQIPEGISMEDITVQAVSIAGTESVDTPISTPTEFSLNQNYPNPFNPTTTIGFTLSTAGEIDLTIYNILGGKVSTLANGHYTAGAHTVDFNGVDLPSGTYFYTLQANGQQETKKMILMK